MSGDHNAHQNDFKPDWDTVKAFDDRYNDDELRIQALQAALDQANMQIIEQREVMQLALEALEGLHPGSMTPMAEEYWDKAIEALREVLGEPE